MPRRLRAYLQYARISVAMALAENNHHSAPWRPTMARARREESDKMNNAMGQKTPPPRAESTAYSSTDDDGEVLAARGVLRHTAAHIVDIVPFVQILGVPVPQLGNQVVQKMDTPSLFEQVIAVPKISLHRLPQRSAVRRPQKAEQLVEVPTIVSFSSLQQQTAEQIIDIPVPGRGGGEVCKVFPQDRIQQHGLWSRQLTFQCLFRLVLEVFKVYTQTEVNSVSRAER